MLNQPTNNGSDGARRLAPNPITTGTRPKVKGPELTGLIRRYIQAEWIRTHPKLEDRFNYDEYEAEFWRVLHTRVAHKWPGPLIDAGEEYFDFSKEPAYCV